MQRPPNTTLEGLTAEEALAEIQRELIKNLRCNLLSPGEREMLAAELEVLWFPKSKAVKDGKVRGRARLRQWKAELYQRMIDRIAAAEGIPKAQAKLKVIEKFKLQSVEALETYIRRADKN